MYSGKYEHFKEYFITFENATRNKGKLLRLPPLKLEAGKRSFKFMGARIFNDLPPHVRAAFLKDDINNGFFSALNQHF